MKNNTVAEIPAELGESGSFADVFKDILGHDINICTLSDGYTITGIESVLATSNENVGQPKLIPKFHSVGFEKVPIPQDIYAQILSNRKKLLSNKSKWSIEYCVPGIQNCNRIVESEKAQECHEVSRGNYFYLPLTQRTMAIIFKKLLPLAEKWIKNQIKLFGTAIYGIRKYTRGARLAAHVDQMQTHVISVIMNIRQVIRQVV